MSLVVVGSVAYDGVETPHGRVERMLGGSCTYAAVAASFFSPAGVVAVVGDDFAREDVAFLASRGIDLTGLEQVPGKTFYWSGVYSADMNERTTRCTDLNVFADFQPKLPPAYQRQPYLLLGNIQPALQRQVRAQMNAPRLVCGDTMNYWITHTREELIETLKQWDVLLINDSETRQLAGCHNLRRAAERILQMGPRTLVVKRGEYGAILFHPGGYFIAPGYLLGEVLDPTGAGDCFAGGFLGCLAGRGAGAEPDPADLRRAMIYGSVMGSFCCERFGVDRFRSLTRAEIDGRYQEFQQFTSF